MFDIMLKKLPNGKILIRDLRKGDKLIIPVSELPQFLEEEFSDDVAAEKSEQSRISILQEEIKGRGL